MRTAILLLTLCVPCLADIKVPQGIGPRVKGFTKEVIRGEETRFMLAVPAQAPGIKLEYLIDEYPKYGKLNLLNVNKGDVVYRSDPKAEVREDQFVFRARLPGGGMFSGKALVRLRIVEPEAVLNVPEEINFGEVIMNGRVRRKLSISNSGNDPFTAKVSAPEGFLLERDEVVLNIPPGGKRVLEIEFLAGINPGKIEVPLMIGSGKPGKSVILRAEIHPPFRVGSKLKLKFSALDNSRIGDLQVNNLLQEVLRLEVLLPNELESGDDIYEIDSGATIPVRLKIPADDTGSFEGIVEVRGGGIARTVQVSADACPPRVVVAGDGSNLLFKGFFNQVIAGNLKLHNEGGRTAFISARVNPPFHLVEGMEAKELKPDQSITYHIELKTDKIGRVEEELKIDYAGDPILVTLKGEVLLPPGMKPPDVVPPLDTTPLDAGTVGKDGRIPLEDILPGRTQIKRVVDRSIPPVRKIRIIEQGERSLAFSWEVPSGGEWDYIVEALVNVRDQQTGIRVPTWIEIDPEYLAITSDQSEVRAEIMGIEPGGEFAFRIFTKNPAGHFSSPAAWRFAIEPKPGLFDWVRIWMFPLLILILIGVFLLARKIRCNRQLYG
ncbi:MAG: fibronectin type III domain-containing protein [Verrucomicrobiales bacterium]